MWSLPFGGKNTPAISGNTIYVFENNGHLLAIDVKTGKIRWNKKFKLFHEEGYLFKESKRVDFYGPYILKEKILLFDSIGRKYYLNSLNGSIEKITDFNKLGSEPLFFSKHIIFLFSNGYISRYN